MNFHHTNLPATFRPILDLLDEYDAKATSEALRSQS